jgi:hypothetical protein
MQAKQCFIAAIAASALLFSATRNTSAAPDNQAFQLDVKLKASYADPASGKLVKTTVTTSTIINLAQGLNLNTVVPTNVVLALVLNCSTNTGSIAVVDTANNTILAFISTVKTDGSTDAKAKGVGSLLVEDMESGVFENGNGIFGGWLAIGGSVQFSDPEAGPCGLTSLKSKSISGIVQGLDAVVAQGPFKLTITGGSMKTVKPLGSVAPIVL